MNCVAAQPRSLLSPHPASHFHPWAKRRDEQALLLPKYFLTFALGRNFHFSEGEISLGEATKDSKGHKGHTPFLLPPVSPFPPPSPNFTFPKLAPLPLFPKASPPILPPLFRKNFTAAQREALPTAGRLHCRYGKQPFGYSYGYGFGFGFGFGYSYSYIAKCSKM